VLETLPTTLLAETTMNSFAIAVGSYVACNVNRRDTSRVLPLR
jgi:hypothetical protein